MPRRNGFRNEDYELARRVEKTLHLAPGTAVPSKVCDAAEEWILIKLRARGKMLWDKGYADESRAIYAFCSLLESGEL